MWVNKVSISGFRNIHVQDINLSKKVNILYGNNAQGKTSFLEALYFCAFGRSLRAVHDIELINFDKNETHVKLDVNRNRQVFTIDAYIQKIGAKSKSKKALAINQITLPHIKDLFGQLLVVMFSPEDLRLIKAGPFERRRFIDMEICQLSPVYYRDLKEYHRALKQRNVLLKVLLKKYGKNLAAFDPVELSIWDTQLAKYGTRIITARQEFIQKINQYANSIHSQITSGKEDLQLIYQPNITTDYEGVLEKNHKRDIIQGTTTVGIHKDDIDFTINNISARFFGSQGQQRTAALSAKLAEIEIIKEITNETPVLLLDDVLSELDGSRQEYLLNQIGELQTLITCTGLEDVLHVTDANILRVDAGTIV